MQDQSHDDFEIRGDVAQAGILQGCPAKIDSDPSDDPKTLFSAGPDPTRLASLMGVGFCLPVDPSQGMFLVVVHQKC